MTPLMRATGLSSSLPTWLEAIELALGAGADVDPTDSGGWTALHYAAWAAPIEVVSLLLESGADPNARSNLDETPLMLAMMSRQSLPEKTAALIAAGADADVQDDEGRTALMLFVHHFQFGPWTPEVARLLVSAGGRTDARDINGLSVLDYLVQDSVRAPTTAQDEYDELRAILTAQ